MPKTRTEIQNEAISVAKENPFVIYEIATGVGKSLIAINIIEFYGGNWDIVIAETTHKDNWIAEFNKHGRSKLLKNVNFYCYQSLKKNIANKNYIFDEVHHLCSDLRLRYLSTIKLNKFIGLSATLTTSQKDKIRNVIGDFKLYKFGLNKAISSEILPEPVVYFVGVELDMKLRIHKFNFNKDKYIMCNQKEYYDRLTQRIDWLKDKYFLTNNQFDKVKWLKAAMDRKKFLMNCKTPHAKELLYKISHKRLICFTGSIEQSEELSNGCSIHSKMGKKNVAKLIEMFNNEEIDQIFATGMLKEGINLNNIEVGLIIQLDNVERYFSQIHGRTLRSQYPEQYVMYVKNTQDEVYCKTALENFNMEYVKFINQ